MDDFMIPMNKFDFSDLVDLIKIATAYENNDNPPLAAGCKLSDNSIQYIQTFFVYRFFHFFRNPS